MTKDKSEEVGEKEYVIDDEDKKTSGLVEECFEKSRKIVVDELVETYGTAEKENGETFGEEALYEQIVLAGKIGKMKEIGKIGAMRKNGKIGKMKEIGTMR